MTTSENRPPGGFALVRLVAGREISTRIRDKSFLISSAVIILLIIGAMVFQVVANSGADKTTIGVVGDRSALTPALTAAGTAAGADVTVVDFADVADARAAVRKGDVDGALVATSAGAPELLVDRDASGQLTSVVQGAVTAQWLARSGVDLAGAPHVGVTALQPRADAVGQRVAVAIVGVIVLYGLLILFGQFVAQGVVEEKASRVVELLLATMRPWQLLAGKILGLGLLGLAQIVVIAVIGVAGALAFDVLTIPTQAIGTAVTVVGWFVLGYAFYASVFAVAASLVSRQEDLATVIMPTTFLLVAGFIIALRAAQDPTSGLSTVTSYVPGLSPTVMPVRQAAGELAWWEPWLSAAVMVVAIVLIVRLGGRVYAGALLRTRGKVKLREALRAERV